jgi:hypothetical protein
MIMAGSGENGYQIKSRCFEFSTFRSSKPIFIAVGIKIEHITFWHMNFMFNRFFHNRYLEVPV